MEKITRSPFCALCLIFSPTCIRAEESRFWPGSSKRITFFPLSRAKRSAFFCLSPELRGKSSSFPRLFPSSRARRGRGSWGRKKISLFSFLHTLPNFGFLRPERRLKSVLFPLPFSPTRARLSPKKAEKERSKISSEGEEGHAKERWETRMASSFRPPSSSLGRRGGRESGSEEASFSVSGGGKP